MSTDPATGLWQFDDAWNLQLPGAAFTVDRTSRAPTVTLTRPGLTVCINTYISPNPPGPTRDAIVKEIEQEHPDDLTVLVDTHTGLRLGEPGEPDPMLRYVYREEDGPFAMVLNSWTFGEGRFFQMSLYLVSLADVDDALVAATSPCQRSTHEVAS